ncbi:2Fe-2S iron-sulfur cluster-binding protein, partial [Escherichia coli]
APARAAATKPVPVAFMASAKEARWTPASGSLLELAEARGLQPEFSCREGTCGTCKTRVLRGAVTHIRQPGVPLAENEALICSAVPAESQSPDE